MFIYCKSHPGKRIEELMVIHGFETQTQLAGALGINQPRCNKTIVGKLEISTEMALRLAAVFPEHTAHEWLDMQAAYDLNKPESQSLCNAITSQLGVTRRIEIMAH